jgi:two-component SAPR family response regulator
MRVFDPRYKEDISPEYVHYQQDVLWIDGELVQSRSKRAWAALGRVSTDPSDSELRELVDEYRGNWGLDFAYEEWALAFRDSLHIRFLELVERTVAADVARGQFTRAIWLARGALAIDPDADQLERILVRVYRLSGSHVAASEQYAHYSRVVRGLGFDPPTLSDI